MKVLAWHDRGNGVPVLRIMYLTRDSANLKRRKKNQNEAMPLVLRCLKNPMIMAIQNGMGLPRLKTKNRRG